MGIDPNILTPEGWHAALAALEWQMDLGVTEITGEDPVDRYALPETVRQVAAPASAPVVQVALATDPVDFAHAAADDAGSLEALRAALLAFDLCALKRGARNTVFASGNPAARVLILSEPPGREEDAAGLPLVGRAGQLLDLMFAAIGLSRSSDDPSKGLYVTPVMPWRPPQDRDPEPDEIAMMRPFVARHIALVNPEIVICMGKAPCTALFGAKGLRGVWAQALGRPVLPMLHPEDLLRNPAAKREAWADLLAIKARLR